MVHPLEEEASASASTSTSDNNASPGENRSARSGSGNGSGSGSGNGGSRPSFTDYWRRTKEAAAKNITFVSSNLEQSSGPSRQNDHHHQQQQQQQQETADEPKTQAKSQARRAQVRKAQIQHRQRKANYTKQLEMDVAELRELIERAEHDGLVLRSENEAIRRRLLLPPLARVPASATATATTSEDGRAAPEIRFDAPAPEYTVNLFSAADSLETPLFQVQRTATPSSWPARSGPSIGLESDSGATIPRTMAPGGIGPGGMADFTEEEIDHAINFILGLEHICWNHFHPSYYSHSDWDPEGKEHGHSLMASAIALQNAPPEMWQAYATEKEQRRKPNPFNPSPNPNPDPPHSNINLDPGPSCAPPSSTTNPTTLSTTTSTTNPSIIASWNLPPSTSGLSLTLASLYGLATALNPADSVELAPVQAWFEIARMYGEGAVRDAAKMDAVRVELARDVDCLHFGAVVQRAAFEGTLERVLGPVPVDGAGGG
ncbi:hypothetical protein GGR53DRAFT_487110 [Hypoxylon sp. FL1150]|nr:hypothetical protein GGR53DRAFT_487110 [Hypoxylon sp. FL1150]